MSTLTRSEEGKLLARRTDLLMEVRELNRTMKKNRAQQEALETAYRRYVARENEIDHELEHIDRSLGLV